MPPYMIRRDVGQVSQEDVDAAAYRAITCAFHFSEMRWIKSYWDREAGVIRCIYEARTANDIYEHAARARIDCNEVKEVTELGPELHWRTGGATHLRLSHLEAARARVRS